MNPSDEKDMLEKVTAEDRIASLKELATFALVAFLLFFLHLILPPVLRFFVHLTKIIFN